MVGIPTMPSQVVYTLSSPETGVASDGKKVSMHVVGKIRCLCLLMVPQFLLIMRKKIDFDQTLMHKRLTESPLCF